MDVNATADVIIVNWNSGSQLAACVGSVEKYGGASVGKCIVVDNGSTDGSTAFLGRDPKIELIQAGQNLGFGRACNRGAAQAGSAFLLFLNPDARLLAGSLQKALAHLLAPENARIGIVGVQLLGEDGRVQRSCVHAPTPGRLLAMSVGLAALIKRWGMPMKTWDHATTRTVDQVMGAFFLVRRDLFNRLGGFDRRFFVYMEEVDFSVRAAQAGYATTYLADAQAFHKGGGVSEQVKAHRLFYSLRSRIQYAFKHFSRLSAVAVACSTLVIEPFSRLALLLGTGRLGDIADLLAGYRMLWLWVLTAPERTE